MQSANTMLRQRRGVKGFTLHCVAPCPCKGQSLFMYMYSQPPPSGRAAQGAFRKVAAAAETAAAELTRILKHRLATEQVSFTSLSNCACCCLFFVLHLSSRHNGG